MSCVTLFWGKTDRNSPEQWHPAIWHMHCENPQDLQRHLRTVGEAIRSNACLSH